MNPANIEYWYCGGCGKYFSDANAMVEIPQSNTVIPAIQEHTEDGSGWHQDETNHWNICECGEILNLEAHTFRWMTDREATQTEPGLRHEECAVCGYAKEAEEIPAAEVPETPEESSGASDTGDTDAGNTDTAKPSESDKSGNAEAASGSDAQTESSASSGQASASATQTTAAASPETGDDASMVLSAVLLIGAGIVLTGGIIYKVRKHYIKY